MDFRRQIYVLKGRIQPESLNKTKCEVHCASGFVNGWGDVYFLISQWFDSRKSISKAAILQESQLEKSVKERKT